MEDITICINIIIEFNKISVKIFIIMFLFNFKE